MAVDHEYDLEDIREFVIRRIHFMPRMLRMTQSDVEALRERLPAFGAGRVRYIRAFMDGYLAAKE